AAEMEERRLFGFPPFCHLVKFLFSASDPTSAQTAAETVRAELSIALPSTVQILPISPSGHSKVKDLYRFQFLIKSLKVSHITKLIQKYSTYPGLKIDIDPTSTLF